MKKRIKKVEEVAVEKQVKAKEDPDGVKKRWV